MREIKFRGKLINSGKWAYGNLCIRKTGTVIITPDETVLGTYGKVNPDTIGQYTGLKDKNGKEIYEGDIVKTFVLGEYINGYIKYNQRKARFDVGWISEVEKYKNNGFVGSCSTFDNEYDLLEVIGNIHDNPELWR